LGQNALIFEDFRIFSLFDEDLEIKQATLAKPARR
jgi:hypothetical protein